MNLKVRCCPVGPVMTNCYLCQNTNTLEMFLVDPGDNAKRILKQVEGVDGILKGILITHGHYDHILGVPEILKEKRVPVYAMEAELPMLQSPQNNMTQDSGRPLCLQPDVLLKDGEEFELCGMKIRALLTPGHTQGGGCFYIEEEKVLFSGDTLFRLSVGRTDFYGGSTEEIIKSVARLYRELPGETIVYPGHDQKTDLAYEMRNNFYVRYSDSI